MDYFNALKVFNIENGADINEHSIKKRYRKMVKKYHPDCCGNDEMYKVVQDAYKEIKLYMKAVKEEILTKEEQNRTYIINMEDLLGIFKGKEIKAGDGTKLNKGSLNTFKVFVKIVVNITIGGIVHEYKFIKSRNIKDEYTVEVIINDSHCSESLDVDVEVQGKRITRTMGAAKMNFRFNMDYISQVNVSIHRVELEEQ